MLSCTDQLIISRGGCVSSSTPSSNSAIPVRSHLPEQAIRVYYRGQLRHWQAPSANTSVLRFLRENLSACGTKEGCNEGDCGACTVVIAELDADQQLQFRAVNSCIVFLPALDGKALFTVEDLASAEGELHPVQQALLEQHGSQCGFCTPGFAMSLWPLYLKKQAQQQAAQRAEVAHCLSGNLCRCTGYRPIYDAAQKMNTYPPAQFDQQTVRTALLSMQKTAGHQHSTERQAFYQPQTLAELLHLRKNLPQALICAGSTDIALWSNKQFRPLPDLISTLAVAELQQIETLATGWRIGAAVSLERAYAFLAQQFPQQLSEFHHRFASLPVRNAGTLGGNLANGSPIGDSAPWLIALQARVILQSSRRSRIVPLEDWYLSYMKKDLAEDEILSAIFLPKPSTTTFWRTYKIAKRFDQDISTVAAGFAVTLDQHQQISAIRLAYGGMAATSARARHTEAALLGQVWQRASLQAALPILANDFQALSDLRAQADYRLAVAQNLLLRWFEDASASLEAKPEEHSV